MVTDPIGIPLEFKYTEPIVVTRLHKILYGPVLERYIHETVIRNRLGKEVRSEPEYFITSYEDKEYLGKIAGREMIALQRWNQPPGEIRSPFTRLREREAVLVLEDGPTLRLAFSTSDHALQHSMVSWLQDAARNMDLLEPLDRVTSALTALCGEGTKD